MTNDNKHEEFLKEKGKSKSNTKLETKIDL